MHCHTLNKYLLLLLLVIFHSLLFAQDIIQRNSNSVFNDYRDEKVYLKIRDTLFVFVYDPSDGVYKNGYYFLNYNKKIWFRINENGEKDYAKFRFKKIINRDLNTVKAYGKVFYIGRKLD